MDQLLHKLVHAIHFSITECVAQPVSLWTIVIGLFESTLKVTTHLEHSRPTAGHFCTIQRLKFYQFLFAWISFLITN
jgi:hypothetical protein